MKVLLISPLYSGGGAERCARDLFRHLPDRGVQATMWVATRREGDPAGVTSLRFPGERYGFPLDLALHHTDWRHLGSRWNLGRVSPRDFDVVHLHNIHGHWISIRAVHDLCVRMPAVWTIHDEWAATGGLFTDLSRVMPESEVRELSKTAPRLMPLHATSGIKRLQRFLARWMPRPTALVAPSRFMQRALAESGRFAVPSIHHIPNGLELLDEGAITMARDEARAKLGVATRGRVVLLVAANLQAMHKGVDLGIDALRGIPRDRRPTVLVLGHNADWIRAQLPGFEIVTRYASDAPTLAAAYRAADVTLVPSRADNLPFIVLESFACKTPVVAFGVGGLVEMLAGERGLTVQPFDTAELRARVLQLFDEPELGAKLADRAHAWVTTECAMDTYLDRITTLYEQVAR